LNDKNTINNEYLSEIRIDMDANTMTIDDSITDKTTDIVSTEKRSVEFPRIHPKYLGRLSQFGYAVEFNSHALFNKIVKYDLIEKAVVGVITLPDNVVCGEAVPIPKKSGHDSDDVYLGLFAHNTKTNISEWIIYDGKTISNTPIARFSFPKHIRVPFGFHGEWIDEADFQRHINS
jgi:carotenoid cleavage dioxygenase-like enzyme